MRATPMRRSRAPTRCERERIAVAVIVCAVALAVGPSHAADVYRIDSVHSSVIFRIRHLGVSYAYGRFRALSGSLQLDAEDPTRSTVQVEIDATSVDTGNDKRDRHLRSADFFEVERFPSITFASTSVRKSTNGAYAIGGDLTLHGVTRPLTLHMTPTGSGPDPWGGFRAGFEGHAVLRRSDFGIDRFDAGAPGALGDEVQLTISVEAVRR